MEQKLEDEFSSVSVWQVAILYQHFDNKDALEMSYQVELQIS